MGHKAVLDNLGGKRAVITGAGSGLGRELSLLLAGRGFRLGIADIDAQGASETLRLVEGSGGSGEMFICDVTSAGQLHRLAEHFFEAWGGVDLLINSAGVAAGGTVGDIPLEDWHWLMDVNFWGTLHACHAFIPRMRAQGRGHIVNIASAAGMVCLPEMSSYNVSKAAIIALSESMRSELAPHGVGVTAACPSFFCSPFGNDVRYTDPYQLEFCEAAFGNASQDSRDIARQVLAAADRDAVYLYPHRSVRSLLLVMRLLPSVSRKVLAWIYRKGIGRPLVLWAARRGLV
jgi:NAD(P)-dependent dehydrogenase (short-subunit alcohol dehydrogenase family)